MIIRCTVAGVVVLRPEAVGMVVALFPEVAMLVVLLPEAVALAGALRPEEFVLEDTRHQGPLG